ncbi:Protein of unknown function [Terribacillus aidingensis]|uniref:DUF3221 domain-containing protein n=1 Tax=Terribacillus aidingensis TaxID=586416 RepID=A0A285NKQ1_9BACI|nr:DUF3221 domain-containing protein [Terribacillus aidingensis]SNZ10104.1 Protein of unknown function [Terribacillus aidingensis]
MRILVLLLAILLAGCAPRPTLEECHQVMNGYLDATEDELYFLVSEEKTEYVLRDAVIPDAVEIGDKISVQYTSVLESYPMQLTVCKVEEG